MQDIQQKPLGLAERALIGGLVFVALLVVGIGVARAAEIVPSVGISRSVDGGDSQFSTGLALRTSVVPFIKGELGVSWRKDTYFNGTVNATTWPLTASVWAAPVPFVYAGGGVGWYNSTLSVPGQPLVANVTERTFGTHVGGGFQMPIAPLFSIDLNGRYVMLEEQSSTFSPTSYDPSFWTASLGLAFKF